MLTTLATAAGSLGPAAWGGAEAEVVAEAGAAMVAAELDAAALDEAEGAELLADRSQPPSASATEQTSKHEPRSASGKGMGRGIAPPAAPGGQRSGLRVWRTTPLTIAIAIADP